MTITNWYGYAIILYVGYIRDKVSKVNIIDERGKSLTLNLLHIASFLL